MILRETFNKHADDYNTYRPHYPQALFTKLIHDAHITAHSTLLEIGPGTGQATEPIARLGCDITGVELGAELANKARNTLKEFSNVRIITSSFEGANLPSAQFDVIYSATAFHWVDPEVRFAKTATLLKPQGYLAIIHTEHVSDEAGDEFYIACHPIYQRYGNKGTSHLPRVSDLTSPIIDRTLFEFKSFTPFPLRITYSARQYVGLLSTYSPVIALSDKKRQRFLADIEELIHTTFDGSVRRNFAMTLTLARKK